MKRSGSRSTKTQTHLGTGSGTIPTDTPWNERDPHRT